MKVLIVSSTYHPFVTGGAEISTQKLAEALAKRGVDTVVLTGAERASVDQLNNVRVRRMRIANLYWSFAAGNQPKLKKLLWHLLDSCNIFMVNALRECLDIEKPDIVLTSKVEDFSPIIWYVAKQKGYPVVHTIRDFGLMCPLGTMFRAGRDCAWQCRRCRGATLLKRLLSRHVNYVVGISHAVLERHLAQGYFANAQSSVIVNIYEAESDNGQSMRSQRTVCFGYLGRLHPTKGVELLIDEFRTANRGCESRLLIAGSGQPEYQRLLKGHAMGLPIEFLGRQNPSEFFAQIDVLVVPSLWQEPLGRVVFEAYAHGIPVIASRRGGIPEIVRPNETGFTFEPNERGALAQLLSSISRDRSIVDRLRQLCLREARKFSEEAVARQYLDLFMREREIKGPSATGSAEAKANVSDERSGCHHTRLP